MFFPWFTNMYLFLQCILIIRDTEPVIRPLSRGAVRGRVSLLKYLLAVIVAPRAVVTDDQLVVVQAYHELRAWGVSPHHEAAPNGVSLGPDDGREVVHLPGGVASLAVVLNLRPIKVVDLEQECTLYSYQPHFPSEPHWTSWRQPRRLLCQGKG